MIPNFNCALTRLIFLYVYIMKLFFPDPNNKSIFVFFKQIDDKRWRFMPFTGHDMVMVTTDWEGKAINHCIILDFYVLRDAFPDYACVALYILLYRY